MVKNSPAKVGYTGSIPGEGDVGPLQYSFLLGKSHGQKSLADYSPWGCKRILHHLVTKTTTKEKPDTYTYTL